MDTRTFRYALFSKLNFWLIWWEELFVVQPWILGYRLFWYDDGTQGFMAIPQASKTRQNMATQTNNGIQTDGHATLPQPHPIILTSFIRSTTSCILECLEWYGHGSLKTVQVSSWTDYKEPRSHHSRAQGNHKNICNKKRLLRFHPFDIHANTERHRPTHRRHAMLSCDASFITPTSSQEVWSNLCVASGTLWILIVSQFCKLSKRKNEYSFWLSYCVFLWRKAKKVVRLKEFETVKASHKFRCSRLWLFTWPRTCHGKACLVEKLAKLRVVVGFFWRRASQSFITWNDRQTKRVDSPGLLCTQDTLHKYGLTFWWEACHIFGTKSKSSCLSTRVLLHIIDQHINLSSV